MIEPTKDPNLRLTYEERARKRISLVEEVDEYIRETILYCDDEEELIALGSVLQILSKNILTTVMDKKDWKHVIVKYVRDVEQETDLGSVRRQYKDYF
jgi:hypothetical protein